MRNHEVTTIQPLLGPDGILQEPGWSRRPLQLYSRADIKKRPTRIKEWDYYSVLSPSGDFGVCFTLSDDGYIGLQSVTFLDFKHAFEHTETILNAFPMGKLHMPTVSSGGSIRYCDKKLGMQFNLDFEQREIKCHFKNFYNGKPLRAQIFLEDPLQDSMVIATPWLEDPHAFYYNQKINCMRARGKVEFDGKSIPLTRLRTTALWTGVAACGPMTTPGTGAPVPARWTVTVLALISVTDLATPPPLRRIFCSTTGWGISWTM